MKSRKDRIYYCNRSIKQYIEVSKTSIEIILILLLFLATNIVASQNTFMNNPCSRRLSLKPDLGKPVQVFFVKSDSINLIVFLTNDGMQDYVNGEVELHLDDSTILKFDERYKYQKIGIISYTTYKLEHVHILQMIKSNVNFMKYKRGNETRKEKYEIANNKSLSPYVTKERYDFQKLTIDFFTLQE